MSGGRKRDLVLIVVLVASWAAFFVPALVDGIRDGRAGVFVFFIGADQGVEVNGWLSTDGWEVEPKIGDRLLQIGGSDATGCNPIECARILNDAAIREAPTSVVLERDGRRLTTGVQPAASRVWWTGFPFSVAILGTSVLILLRAPEWHLSRRWLLSSWCWAVFATGPFVGQGMATYLWGQSMLLLGGAGVLLNCQELSLSARPVPTAHRLAVPLFVAIHTGLVVTWVYLPVPGTVVRLVGVGLGAFLAGACLAGLTRCYRLSDELERRQIRWVVLGFYFSWSAWVLLGVGVNLAHLRGDAQTALGVVNAVLNLGAPAGILIAIVGYRWLDVDRVISAAASYTLIGGVAVVVALAAVPGVADSLSESLAVSPGTVQTILTLVIAGVAYQVHRAVRPRLDRRMFADRHARAHGFEDLLGELGTCTTAAEVITRSGERLAALLEPSSIAIYAREEAAFTPVFLRGRAVPSAFDAESPLVRTLEQRSSPLSAESAELDPFDRAALETLDVVVVVPTRLGESVAAFTCLGRKSSGDIYTPEELAYLSAVANRASEVLGRIDGEAMVRDAQQMQHALRRYVPGAVANALDTGTSLDSSEVEVSVLFVDIRGYTEFAEHRRSEDVFSAISDYTGRVSEVVGQRGGSVVEFHGDGLVAVFGAPSALDEKERAAVEAARDLVTVLGDDVSVGVGIATGNAFVGNIQSSDRLIWTVIGDVANLASRLQSMTRELDASLAIDATTRERAGYVCADFEQHTNVAIRGRRARVEVWSLPLRERSSVES